ncbi:Protein kinase, catalytic domain-containing protein [Cynara cardunculus var. scolymus]|uniref:Protein kinase, catalytic domain-containing protein n=1 Tax=Cynara cardunculus var. scolymus TaxID=59895 RepID=A0A124SCJ6_CYNCS|nr:Protein kinase, catalytic domain-containing protein [Cynara cardunculus var. scolymus]
MTENEDGLDYLRIPYEKIKFGKKLEVQGYGTVFEGEFDDRRVALKQLNITNLGNVKPTLLAEILTISRFRRHPNLVALLGFCDEKINEIILIYEYALSGNLADKMRKRLTTIQRLEICLGAARGLDYLHTGVDATTPGITHGNIKLAKILLNSDSNSSKFEAKVSSFGLSKILPGQAQKILESTDTADEVTERVTKESDVYSFGVLLLEVLCGVPELVDTDDYQERHVTELVPKRLEQNKLRKIVHFDIRKEIKTESLETYAKIACRCVLKSSEERPSMAQVVEELEKALRLQGGEVSDVQIVGSRTIDGAPDGTVVAPPEDGSSVMADSELDDAGREVSVVGAISESTDAEENAAGDVSMQERSFPVPISNGINVESVPDITHIEDAQKDNINDLEASEEIADDSNSKEKSKANGERKDQSKIIATSSESSNGDTSTTDHSLNQEVQNSGFLESSSRNCDNIPNQNQDGFSNELEHLRIPYEKIIFGKKIDIHGYGSMFEGEFDHQQVALKWLNITNLAHIKSNLLAEILTVARFRQHPNIVALLGFCDEKSNEIILVYEYVSSGNLADKMSKHLTTIQRLEICIGAARGLDYLHTGVNSTPGIVHGDIKLPKILLNSHSTPLKFEAKVSGFGLSKLLPGQAQKTLDPTDKASDVYSFGVLLLEVLCGVPELVDTDDYQERHVTELVPKRLEQNILRTIVHIDIRDEITTESLETYAKIACLCVMKDPEERPTMAQVVEELEKALKLQGREVSDVLILGSSNGNVLPEETIDEDDQKGDDDGETKKSNIEEKFSEVKETIDDRVLSDRLDLARENNGDEDTSVDTSSEDRNGEKDAAKDITTQEQSFPVTILGGEDGERVDKSWTNDPERGVEIIDDLKLKEESEINREHEVDNKSKIATISSQSNDGKNRATEIIMKVQSSGILDSGSANAGKENSTLLNLHDDIEKKPESIIHINVREGDFNDFTTNNKFKSIQESESKAGDDSISTCSESSNGDGTTPSDHLLQKSPANGITTQHIDLIDTHYVQDWV